jgi:hypothetical protein
MANGRCRAVHDPYAISPQPLAMADFTLAMAVFHFLSL